MPIRITRTLTGVPALVLAAGLVAACRPAGATSSVARCAVGDTALVRDVLYFGRNTPGGPELSDSAWQQYVDEVLTPGLVAEAIGEYKRRFAQEAVLRERVTTCSRF